MSAVVEEVKEYFTLRTARAKVAASSTDQRAKVTRARLHAEEARRSAEILWGNGSPSAALRLAREAVVALVGALAEPSPSDDLESVLQRLGCSDRERSDLVAAHDAVTKGALPELDADVAPEHARLFFDVVAAMLAVERRVHLFLMTDGELATLRGRRRMRAAIACALVAAFLVAALRSQVRVRAEASAVYDAHYEPARVLDGNKDSEWLLPDQTGGWLDLYVIPPRKVTKVQLLNAHNDPFHDRGSHEITIELYSKEQLVKSIDYAFAGFEARPEWVSIDVGPVEKVQRVRIVVKSWFLAGGGIAEARLQ